jgi:hypothetical protein
MSNVFSRRRPKVFISYRRAPSSLLATLIYEKLKSAKIDAFLDVKSQEGGGLIPQWLREAVDKCDILVCVLANTTLNSDWVRQEIKQAYEKKKILIPVFHEDFIIPSPVSNRYVEALLNNKGVKFFDKQNLHLDQSIQDLIKMIKATTQTAKSTGLSVWETILFAILLIGVLIVSNIILSPYGSVRQFFFPSTPTGGGVGRMTFASDRNGITQVHQMMDIGSYGAGPWEDTANVVFHSWSPDSLQLAFASNIGGNYDIYIMGFDHNPVNLTNDDAYDEYPVWSPDGRHISFGSIRDSNFEIYVIDTDGTNPTRLTDNLFDDYWPTWSPDGEQIAFSSNRDGNNEIYKFNSDGSAAFNLTNHNASDEYPKWSPDGERIAFSSNRDGNNEIYLMSMDGSNPVNLTNNAADDYFPEWSPDGTLIAFVSNRDGNNEIYLMRADGSNLINLTNNGSNDTAPAWRP